MAKRALLVALLPLVLAACGDDGASGVTEKTVAATTATPAPPANPPQTSIAAFFLRGDRLAPARVLIPRTAAVAASALRALADDAPAGYDTATDHLNGDLNLRIDDGVAQVEWGDARLSRKGAAQVVYTLTQFPTIRAVELPNGVRGTRKAYADVVAPILVETPLPGDDVASPIVLAGSASVYEATLVVELRQGGTVLEKQTVTAETGAPERGAFSARIETDARGDASVVVYSPSAADGSEQHRVEVPVRLAPPAGGAAGG